MLKILLLILILQVFTNTVLPWLIRARAALLDDDICTRVLYTSVVSLISLIIAQKVPKHGGYYNTV